MVKRKNKKKNRRGLQAVTLCISTAMVLVLLGMVVFSVFTAHNLSEYVKENFVITLTLEDDMTQPETRQLTNSLKQKIYVNRLDYVSKEDALKEETQAMGSDPTEFIGENPFMASVELYLEGDYANSDSLVWIQNDLKKFKKISEVTYQRDLMDSVNTNLRRINIILLILACLLTCVSFTLISNTVRLGIYSRRFNIRTMKLVGASWGFIRRPFILQSVWIGLLAAMFADIILAGAIFALYNYQPYLLTIVTWQVMIITGLSVFAFGLFITWFCTYISVNKFLKMTAGELYKI